MTMYLAIARTGKKNMLPSSEHGFTLIEIAIVLVVIGLLVGFSAPMIKVMSQRAKHVETINILHAARESVAGFALTAHHLPVWGNNAPDSVAVDEFCEIVSQRTDSGAQPLRYIYDTRPTADICAQTDGYLTVIPLNEPPVSNVAYVIVSGGGNYVIEAGIPGSGGVNTATTITQSGDDLLGYMTIYELQSLAGCSDFDRCTGTGISVANQHTGSLSYRRNGGACTTWNSGAAILVDAASMIDVHVGTGCTSVTATWLTFAQQKKEIDLDDDCLTAVTYNQATAAFPMYDR